MKSTNLAQFAAVPDDAVWKRATNIDGYNKCTLWYRYLWNRTYIQLRGVLDCSTGSPGLTKHVVCSIAEDIKPESAQYFVSAINGTGFCQVGYQSDGTIAVFGNQFDYTPTAVYIPGVTLPLLSNYKSAGGPRRLPVDDLEEEPAPEPPYEVEGESPEANKGESKPAFGIPDEALEALESAAKLSDPEQIIVAKSVVAGTYGFDSQRLIRLHETDEGGNRPSYVYIDGPSVKAEQLAYLSDIAAKESANVANALAEIDLNSPELATFRKGILDEVRAMLAGGKTVPEDIDWTECPKINGSGLVEARLLNGIIQLRGEVVVTYTSTGTFYPVRSLPAGFPNPAEETKVLVFGIEQNVAYRRVFVRFIGNKIEIVGDGKITAATLTGAQAYAY